MSIQYLPQGVPIVSSSQAVSSSYALSANNSGIVTTASLAGHALSARGVTGVAYVTRNASTVSETGSQGTTILVRSTGSLAFKMATSSFSTDYNAPANIGPIDISASYGGGPGFNPTLNLVRGRQYRFLIRGTPPSGPDSKFVVTNNGASAYNFSVGATGNNPTLTLVRGYRYEFEINAPTHPFHIQTVSGGYNALSGVGESGGVYNSGSQNGTIIFNVPHNAPNTLYYVCAVHSSMAGTINIVDDGLSTFVIQTTSGSFVSSSIYKTGVTPYATKSGSMTFAVSASAPSTLYYASAETPGMRGQINITG